MKRQWYYRGSLKSCNYSCSYCPFSKKKGGKKEIEKDKRAWFQFVEKALCDNDIEGAVQVVPYGEALIHTHYWEGLAALSKKAEIDVIGAQSNFSFPVERMLDVFEKAGGKLKKLRLWGTYHPEMTTMEAFVKQCSILSAKRVIFCVGAVGVPEHIELIRKLRKMLPEHIYLWINKMDGLGRAYTLEEEKAFLEIDEYFSVELKNHKPNLSQCWKNRFVEADGTIRRCNICPQTIGNIYENFQKNEGWDFSIDFEQERDNANICTRKNCSCFLSYSNQNLRELLFFQPYPGFRIPVYPKGVFFDIDGTLIPEGCNCMPNEYIQGIKALANHSKIYLATSLPYEIARQSVNDIWEYVDGGVFGNGGLCIWKENGEQKECIKEPDVTWLSKAKSAAREYKYKLFTYERHRRIYKVTLVFYGKNRRKIKEQDFLDAFVGNLGIPDTCQFLLEGNCFQITAQGTGKLQGVLDICGIMGYEKEQVMVAGDSENDMPMLNYFSHSVKVCRKMHENYTAEWME